MQAYIFLYKKMLRNRIRQVLKRPATCIYILFMVLYFGWLAFMLNGWIVNSSFGTRENLARILCMFSLYLTPANYAAYAKRKGLAFLPADVHFLFSAPTSAKGNLLYVYGKTMISIPIIGIFTFIAGIHWFHVSWWKMLLYVLICFVLDSILQGAIVVLLYGNERIGKNGNRIFSAIMYGIIGSFVVIAIVIICKYGMQWSSLLRFFDGKWISMIPLIGWSLAVMRLIILGPSLLNIICATLYLAAFVLLTAMALKMKCTGQYYEDAAKFADDYQDARRRGKKGEVVVVGKKKKYKKAEVVYKGSGAKAIFYRQLLEYKKERFFIFGFVTLLYLAGGMGICYLAIKDPSMSVGVGRYFIIPGIMAYVSFLLCSYKTKWAKELDNPYVFLIPEPAFQKMWYATLIDHIRAAIHALLLTVPAMIGLHIEWWYLPVIVLLQVCMNAVGLYSNTICQVIFGNTISDTVKRVLHMLLYFIALLIVVFAAAIVTAIAGVWAGLGIASVYMVVLAGLMAWGGSRCFARMES